MLWLWVDMRYLHSEKILVKVEDLVTVDFSDIQGDVNRRDLTINSLFYDIEKNEVVDLTVGLEDLKNKIVKTVVKQRFDEDPLRKL